MKDMVEYWRQRCAEKHEELDRCKEERELYAKQQAIAFANYRDEFKREESRKVREEQKRVGGIFSWIGRSDEEIYAQFIEQQTKYK